MIKPLAFLMVLAAACLMLLPARAQDATPEAGDGRGVVTLSAEQPAENTFLYACTGSSRCTALQMLLLQRLFDVDPASGVLLGADKSDRALVRVVPSDLPSDEVTLKLADRRWSDGQPMTAYDVLFTWIAHNQSPQSPYLPGIQGIAGVRVVDDRTLQVRFAATAEEIAKLPPDANPPTATCDALPRLNVTILPAHTLLPAFRAFAEQHAPPGDTPTLAEWWKAIVDANLSFAENVQQFVPGGTYRAAGDGQFVPVDGTGAVIQNVTNVSDPLDAFIAGDTNVLLDVPVEERAGVRLLANPNRGNVHIAEVPGRESLIIVLNLGNPQRPLPGIHPATGAVLDQGTNPLFSDPAVRRALQLAIDPNALIDGVMQRSAVPLAGLYPPSSWAFDPTLPKPETNLQKAKQLLDDAGWIDNGVARVCHGCKTAPDGTQLRFSLGSDASDSALASEITAQWAQIDVRAAPTGDNSSSLTGQTFDAYLLRVGGDPYEDADPDRTLMLTPAGDILDPDNAPPVVLNYGSYNNPQVTDLLAQARTVPGCDPAARAAIYHQVEGILQGDLPFLSVAAPTEFYAAAAGVRGFAPRTGDPFWNVESWTVAP